MRPAKFVEHIPDVIPPLLDIAELEAVTLRSHHVATFLIDPLDQDPALAIGSFPIEHPVQSSDVQQLAKHSDLHRSGTLVIYPNGSARDRLVSERTSLETSLAALVRISESDLSSVVGKARRQLGREALKVLAGVADISLVASPASYWPGIGGPIASPTIYLRQPSEQIKAHAESYRSLLPYMTHYQRKKFTARLLAAA